MTDQPQRERPPRKPRFRRRQEWVAIKPVRVSSTEHIKPGDPIPDRFRQHYLRHLWRRGSIGPKGSDYTAYMLGLLSRKQARKGAADAEDLEQVAVDHGHTPAPDADASIEVDAVGGGWHSISKGGEVLAKLRGAEAVNAWLEDHGYEPAL